MSREDQYSFCKDHFSLRRLGFSEAAILKHLPPPQQGPTRAHWIMCGIREPTFRLIFVTINAKNYSSTEPWFLCFLVSFLHSQLYSNSREATYYPYGDPREQENQAICLSYENIVITGLGADF